MRYLFIMLLALIPNMLPAQGTARDSAIANKIRYAKDSVYCSSANPYRDRCGRAKITLDSIMTSLRCGGAVVRQNNVIAPWKCAPTTPPEPAPVASVTVGFTWRTELYYNSPTDLWPVANKDTVTVCALVVEPDSTKRIGWPPARMTVEGRQLSATAAVNDSASLVLRGGNPLAQMCGFMAHRATQLDSVPVTWQLDWFGFADRMYRPSAGKAP